MRSRPAQTGRSAVRAEERGTDIVEAGSAVLLTLLGIIGRRAAVLGDDVHDGPRPGPGKTPPDTMRPVTGWRTTFDRG